MSPPFRLVDPDPAYHRSFLAAADEFIEAGQAPYAGIPSLAADNGFAGVHFTRAGLEGPDEFARPRRAPPRSTGSKTRRGHVGGCRRR